jgi:hypothetical protein
MPRIPALRRSAPTVRFIAFETLVTGVLAFECIFNSRRSSFVHGLGRTNLVAMIDAPITGSARKVCTAELQAELTV